MGKKRPLKAQDITTNAVVRRRALGMIGAGLAGSLAMTVGGQTGRAADQDEERQEDPPEVPFDGDITAPADPGGSAGSDNRDSGDPTRGDADPGDPAVVDSDTGDTGSDTSDTDSGQFRDSFDSD